MLNLALPREKHNGQWRLLSKHSLTHVPSSLSSAAGSAVRSGHDVLGPSAAMNPAVTTEISACA